jgi:hypothetical protein
MTQLSIGFPPADLTMRVQRTRAALARIAVRCNTAVRSRVRDGVAATSPHD